MNLPLTHKSEHFINAVGGTFEFSRQFCCWLHRDVVVPRQGNTRRVMLRWANF